MGGDSDRAYECAVEMTRAWEHAENFELYEDTLPVLAALREHGLKIGLVSNTGRDLDAFVGAPRARRGRRGRLGRAREDEAAPGDLPVAALEQLGVTAEEAAMVGDSPEDDVEGAQALGMRAFLVDREDRFPEVEGRLPDLLALPAALGLSGRPRWPGRLSPKPQTCPSTT